MTSMKATVLLCILSFSEAVRSWHKSAIDLDAGDEAFSKGDRTVTEVVRLLNKMLDKSKAEGEEERVSFAKFKCYCDDSDAEKVDAIKEATTQIAILQDNIEEAQASVHLLSSESHDLENKIQKTEEALSEANEIRDKEEQEWRAKEKEYFEGEAMMKRAIDTLTAVGADQTSSTGADNKQFMAGKGASLISLQTQMKNALRAAKGLMNQNQEKVTTDFLQGPITGTYTSQSAQVMGVLKSMRDTFIANRRDGEAQNQASKEAHLKLIGVLEKSIGNMTASNNNKQNSLGSNDMSLAAMKKTLDSTQKKEAADTEFLEALRPVCKEKATGFANRKLLRTQEEAAIAQAISILNSDESADAFRVGLESQTAKREPDFLQLSSSHRRIDGSRRTIAKMLRNAARNTHSARLSKVASLLAAHNPFEAVLKEIQNMARLIQEEEDRDKEKQEWCDKERSDSKEELHKKDTQLTSLADNIRLYSTDIEHPKDGLLKLIEETEDSLEQNKHSQATETQERTEANLLYQKDVKNLKQAQSILRRAIKALKAYYDKLEEKLAAQYTGEVEKSPSFLQEDPTPPAAWKKNGAYVGQSNAGDKIIKLLEYIHKSTVEEEGKAHEEEQTSQHEYEDSMTAYKKQEMEDEKLLAKTQDTLAQTEKDLLEAQEDHKATQGEIDALKDYLHKIRPGCDFITFNFALRMKNRKKELEALRFTAEKIQETPAYKEFATKRDLESVGDCKHVCKARHDMNAECQACLADVTIPAYCANHRDVPGCEEV